MFILIFDFLKTPEGASLTTALATVVLTVTTMIYAWLTAQLARENKLLRRAGTEPQIVAYLWPHPRVTGPLQFILANVGQGPALDVSFRLTKGGDDFEDHDANFPEPSVPLTVIPHGERYEVFFAMGWDLLKAPRLKPFSVEVNYKDLSKRRHAAVFEIDVTQFDGRRTIRDHPEDDLLKAVKSIGDEMQKWTARRLPVETMTRDDHKREQREWMARARDEA